MAVIWTVVAPYCALSATEAEIATLKVLLYDYVGLEPGLTQRSVHAASQAFLRAGLPSEWELCRSPRRPREEDCRARPGPLVVQMRLHPRSHGKKLDRSMYEFGYAITPQGGFGVIAGVYVDRAQLLAREQGYSLAVILGHAMAHEIGHLLLGARSHSRSGLMTRVWRDRELRLASTGLLRFSSKQARRMRRQVSVRPLRAEPSRVLTDSGLVLVGKNLQLPGRNSLTPFSYPVPALPDEGAPIGLRRP